MAGVDLNLYRFDYDLTFAILLMNADGTTYRRYGGRDWRDASSRLSLKGLIRVMRETLEDHAAYQKNPSPPPASPKRTVEEIPPMARKLRAKPIDCIHCHMVNTAEREFAQEQRRWSRDAVWTWPLPDQVGIRLDPDDPARVAGVTPRSPAAGAGLKPDDRLVRLGDTRVRTEADAQWALENAPAGAAALPLEYDRGGEAKKARLSLAKGWKAGTPLEFSWRSSMWDLRPAPGFGGGDLAAGDKEQIGLRPDAFAFRVGHIVDWGDHPEYGRNAAKAGIRKGDVVVSAGEKSDFASQRHFQSWYRLTAKPGTPVDIGILRDGKPQKVRMDVIP